MRIIRPKRGDPEWKKEFDCGDTGEPSLSKPGCGARLEIVKADLFMAEMELDKATVDISSYVCSACGQVMPCGEPFDDLPNFAQWKERRAPPYR